MSHSRREGSATRIEIVMKAELPRELVTEMLLRRVASGISRRITMDSNPGKPVAHKYVGSALRWPVTQSSVHSRYQLSADDEGRLGYSWNEERRIASWAMSERTSAKPACNARRSKSTQEPSANPWLATLYCETASRYHLNN
jgi:hypothetical protein